MNKFTAILCLLTYLPSFLFPQDHLPQVTYEQACCQHEKSLYSLSYDEILELLDELESGELEKNASLADLERINAFIAHLAREGVLADDVESSLEEDIEDLLDLEETPYLFAYGIPDDYTILPHNPSFDAFLCKKNWIEKQWKQTKKFVKKHKEEIIIGAVAVVVVVTVVTVVVVTGGSAAAAVPAIASVVGVADAATSSHHDKEDSTPTAIQAVQEAPLLKETVYERVYSFKETLAKEQYFPPSPAVQYEQLSWEENARTLGSLFAHDSLKHIEEKISTNPELFQEVQKISKEHHFPPLESMGHGEIDRKFSTDYSTYYKTPEKEFDFNTLSYLARGEKALSCGYLHQAVQDLGKAITLDPTNPLPYLERGIAHLGLGQYEESLEDYEQFAYQREQTYPLSVPDFSRSFAKALPKGVYESGRGMLTFISDIASHPIHTGMQTWEAFTLLAELAKEEDWKELRKVLVPEIDQLITEWNTLPSDKRGELAGYAFGKYGADIAIPGALAKTLGKLKSAKALSTIQKTLKTAEQTLLLESAASLESGARIAEFFEAAEQTLVLSEELGLTAGELSQLKQAGQLEGVISYTFENISGNPALYESFELFDRAQVFLKPYRDFMSEAQCKELIHKTGIPTFSRPTGIPENFRVRISDKGAGIIYLHPEHAHTSIRVMPGKPHSPLPYQQKPYVIYRKHGKTLDKFGNVVDSAAPEAHIPLEEFSFKD